MQKLIKRTAEAQRNAANRAKKKSLQEFKRTKGERIRESKINIKSITSDLHRARQVRREAWELGPLAPRRDLDGHMSHAALRGGRLSPRVPLKSWEVEARCHWAGGSKYLNLAVGDRVVITQGPDKGIIDKVAKIDLDTATLELAEAGKVRFPGLYPTHDRGISGS